MRTGFRRLTIVDSDRVCLTNINRQLMATTATVGEVKVEALRRRLLGQRRAQRVRCYTGGDIAYAGTADLQVCAGPQGDGQQDGAVTACQMLHDICT